MNCPYGSPGTGLAMPHRRHKGEELPDWKQAHHNSHKQVRTRVERGTLQQQRGCWKGEASARIRRCSPASTPGATANGSCEPAP